MNDDMPDLDWSTSKTEHMTRQYDDDGHLVSVTTTTVVVARKPPADQPAGMYL